MSHFILERDLSRHPLHYFVLLSLELIGLWGLIWFSYQRSLQLAILVTMTLAYIVWGIVHHQQHHDLHPKIIFEYITIAIFALLLIGSLIFHS